MALTELSQSRYRGYLRKDEEWPVDSEQYKAGCDIENRKRPPPEEAPGDVFDRQRVIPGFDQSLMERQVCLVLGAGGIGQNVALTLGRLGVQKIILVDNDVYAASNLTRQCLGKKSDVGRRKVDVAKDGLEASHNLRSDVVAVHCDVLVDWPTVVQLAKECTVVFNAIDVGVMWDFCVNSLCKELEVPLCAGQSFGWKFMTELYTGQPDEVCAFCYDSVSSTFAANEKAITRPGGLLARLKYANVQSAAELQSFLAADRQFRCRGPELQVMVERILESMGGRLVLEWPEVLKFLQSLQEETLQRLLPGRVGRLQSLEFIPQPKHAETRFVGSWVCPCLSCAVTMVSQWSGLLTGPEVEEEGVPLTLMPQSITFNLDAGMTGEEQLGYELGALGMCPDRQERRNCRDAARDTCAVCCAARRRRAEEQLFTGAAAVVLAPCAGEARGLPQQWSSCPSQVMARQQPLCEEGLNHLVPALPASDWLGDFEACRGWPSELSYLPLLKVRATSSSARHPSALRGVTSGVRSALVKVRGRWFRLKGCGNREEGFILAKVGNEGESSLRGCCFKHTACTELRMSQVVQEVLDAAKVDSANVPLGLYWYQPEPSWPLPALPRYCGVFETLGDARLGDHLLGGLLQLWPHLQEPREEMRQWILEGRGAEELLETCDLVACGLAAADVLRRLKPQALRRPVEAKVSESHQLLWKQLAEELEASDATLLWLGWRLGWECGETLRWLHRADISWGTYSDRMGIHCNAHVNNFIIKPPSSGRSQTFLAALDFDMAFTRSNFMPEAVQGGFLATFDEILAFEESMGMKMVLAGSDFASTGVSNVRAPEPHRIMEMALRDTMVTAYTAALENQVDAHPPTDEQRRAAYEIIKLALCLTLHVEG